MEYDVNEVLEVLQNAERLGVPIANTHDLATAMMLRTLYNNAPGSGASWMKRLWSLANCCRNISRWRGLKNERTGNNNRNTD